MGETIREIESAVTTLGLSTKEICRLDDVAGRKVFDECLKHFVKNGDRKWWWEDFKETSFIIEGGDKPFELLTEILPTTKGNIWLIAEDDQEAFYPVYDVTPGIVGAVIGECFAFDYYLIDKSKEWLLCENHHNTLIGVGAILKIKNSNRLVKEVS